MRLRKTNCAAGGTCLFVQGKHLAREETSFIRPAAPPLTGAACRIRFSKIFSGGKRFSALHVCALRFPSVEYLDFEIYSGAPLPRYLTHHTLARLTRQHADTLPPPIHPPPAP